MTASPHISLIFVNYRSAGYLAQALESLLACERRTNFWEVIVVNNDVSESDALRELKKIFPFLIIESGENIGFGRGNNLGAKSARGKILGFINPDVLWTGAHLDKIARTFSLDQTLGVLGMALLGADKKPEPWSAGKWPSLVNLFCNNFFHMRQLWEKGKNVSSSDWVSGGALFIRATLFSAIGGFDEQFFLYFEDVDLCVSARQHGFSVARYSTFPLIHLGGQSQYSTQIQKKHFLESQKKYFAKRRPRWESGVLTCLQVFLKRIY